MRRRRSLLPLVLLPLLLTACSGDETGGSSSQGDPTSEDPLGRTDQQRAASKEDLRPCTTRPTETDGLTDPGQVLCFGTPAVLPLGGAGSDSYTGAMRLTVTGIDRGDDAVIDREITPGFGEWTSASRDLWFIRARAELLDDDVAGALDDDEPIGFTTNLVDVDGVSGDSGATGSLEGCDHPDFGDGGGRPFATCDWALLQPDAEGWSVRWFDTDDYVLDQVVWTAE